MNSRKSHTYDVVIATRNRVDALALSIPLLLGQNRRPEKIVIVDSSDDPEPVREIVVSNSAVSDVPIKLIRSLPGLPLQRNIGLREVNSDVVFFPDDDSLVLPGALEAMMRIYDRDEERAVGGVCSAEATKAPVDVLDAAQSTYQMTKFDRLKQKIASVRYAWERRLVPDPFITHGRSRWDVRETPSWLKEEDAVLVEYMTGFRMSFRTEVIRAAGFHEPLGRYALAEDIDASFSVLRTHLLVGARRAEIFHYKAPGARASGRELGMMHILNRAYVLLRFAPPDSLAARQLKRHCRYKILQYATGAGSRFGRERLAGAVAAFRLLPKLFEANREELEKVYCDIRAACIAAEPRDVE